MAVVERRATVMDGSDDDDDDMTMT